MRELQKGTFTLNVRFWTQSLETEKERRILLAPLIPPLRRCKQRTGKEGTNEHQGLLTKSAGGPRLS